LSATWKPEELFFWSRGFNAVTHVATICTKELELMDNPESSL